MSWNNCELNPDSTDKPFSPASTKPGIATWNGMASRIITISYPNVACKLMALYVTVNPSYPKVVVKTISTAMGHTAAGLDRVIRASMLPDMLKRQWGSGCDVCFLMIVLLIFTSALEI